jgi:hypothetical protein
MPVWRCPHCATPQPETSRCWVCRRSTTACGTCRHFRRGVAGGLGLCGLDPRRPALTGSEMRACWVAAPQPSDPTGRHLVAVGPGRIDGGYEVGGAESWRRPRTFVPVERSDAVAPAAGSEPSGAVEPSAAATGALVDEGQPGITTDSAVTRASAIAPATGAPGSIPGTWWLWGDPEPWPDL